MRAAIMDSACNYGKIGNTSNQNPVPTKRFICRNTMHDHICDGSREAVEEYRICIGESSGRFLWCAVNNFDWVFSNHAT